MGKRGSVPFDSSELPGYLERELTRLDQELVTYGTKAYVPDWTAVTANPVLGNGSLTARYRLGNDLCELWLWLRIGSTTTLGTGAWRFSIPSLAKFAAQYGTGTVWDASAGTRTIVACEVLTTDALLRFRQSGVVTEIGPATPMAWAQNDELTAHIRYLR